MARVRPLLLLVLAFAAAFATADAARALKQSVPEPLQPIGVWQAARTVTVTGGSTICGLRDFPPIGGEGESRMLCGGSVGAVSPYWVWKATKPGALPNGTDDVVVTGEPVNLRIFTSMLTYCRTHSNGQLWCGVGSDLASNFTFEKVGDPTLGVSIDWDSESVYLKQGNRYCRVQGSGNSAYVFCNAATQAQASLFQFPTRSFYSVRLASVLSQQYCGATFIVMDPFAPAYVNCTRGAAIPSNFYTRFVASLRVPGAGFASGNDFTFMTFDSLWHYQVAAWSAATPQVVSLNNDMQGNKFYFTVDKVNTTAGNYLQNGDIVTLKSVTQNKYCGIATPTSNMLCNAASASSNGYKFVWIMEDARNITMP